MDTIYTAFLERQIAEASALARSSDLLEFFPAATPAQGADGPPNHFIAEFRCRGLIKNARGQVVEFDRWGVGIRFPEDYLRSKLHVAEILTYLGPAPRPWHPNIREVFICLHLKPGMPLVEILFALFDLLSWNKLRRRRRAQQGGEPMGAQPAARSFSHRPPSPQTARGSGTALRNQ